MGPTGRNAPAAPKGPVGPTGTGGTTGAPATPGNTPPPTPSTGAPLAPRTRGPSAKSLLKMPWQYPAYAIEQAVDDGGTIAKRMRRALSREDAFHVLAGEDPRPLLVLRECQFCNGTDDALLTKGADNERTFLLATWFHCVKLPIDVLQTDNPFYELFGHDDPEHLFVASPDGSNKVPLESDTSRTELWDDMTRLLALSYKQDTRPVVKLMQKSLDRLDALDARLLDLQTKRNALLETESAGSTRSKKLEAEIADAQRDIAAVREEIAKATKLELKSPNAVRAGAGAAKADR